LGTTKQITSVKNGPKVSYDIPNDIMKASWGLLIRHRDAWRYDCP